MIEILNRIEGCDIFQVYLVNRENVKVKEDVKGFFLNIQFLINMCISISFFISSLFFFITSFTEIELNSI